MINVFMNFAFDFKLSATLLPSNAKQILQSIWSWTNEKKLCKQADILTFWLIGKSHSLYTWLIMFIFLQIKPGIQMWNKDKLIELKIFDIPLCYYLFFCFFENVILLSFLPESLLGLCLTLEIRRK